VPFSCFHSCFVTPRILNWLSRAYLSFPVGSFFFSIERGFFFEPPCSRHGSPFILSLLQAVCFVICPVRAAFVLAHSTTCQSFPASGAEILILSPFLFFLKTLGFLSSYKRSGLLRLWRLLQLVLALCFPPTLSQLPSESRSRFRVPRTSPVSFPFFTRLHHGHCSLS